MKLDSNTLALASEAREVGFFAQLARTDAGLGLALPGAILAEGKDAARFLHSQVTNEVEALEPGNGNFSARVTRQGQLLHFFSLHRLPVAPGAADQFLLLLERGEIADLIAAFDDFLFSDDVNFTDVSEQYQWTALQGPDVDAVIAACTPANQNDLGDWAPYNVRAIDIAADTSSLVIARTLTGDTGFLIATPARSHSAASKVDARLEYAANDAGLLVVSEPELSQLIEIMRIEAGQVRVGPDTDGRKSILPETGLEQHAVSYTKGCYLGQEVIARVRTYGALPYGLRGLVFECAQKDDWPQQMSLLERLPASGEDLHISGRDKSVGQIVSRTLSPLVGYPIAFAYLDKEHRTPGTELDIEVGDGAMTARVALLPFYSAPDRDERVAYLYDRAVRVFAQGAEEEALAILEDALQLDPGFSDAYEAIGVILGRSERFHEAIDIFKRLEELVPEAAMVNTNLSLYYMKIGDKTAAESEAAKAMQKSLAESTGIKVNSDELDAQLLEQERVDAKRKLNMFSQVLEIDEEDSVALFGMGNALSVLEDWERAEECYAKASEFDPKNSAVYLARGKVLEALGASDRALDVFRAGMEVASRQGDLMPLKDMEHRVLLLSATAPSATASSDAGESA
jgi:folate-binding protein YgfZ